MTDWLKIFLIYRTGTGLETKYKCISRINLSCRILLIVWLSRRSHCSFVNTSRGSFGLLHSITSVRLVDLLSLCKMMWNQHRLVCFNLEQLFLIKTHWTKKMMTHSYSIILHKLQFMAHVCLLELVNSKSQSWTKSSHHCSRKESSSSKRNHP